MRLAALIAILFWVIVIALLSIALPARADVVLHLASYHPDVRDYNEINPGLGWRSNGANFIALGTYKNSIDKQSSYLGGGVTLYESPRFAIAIGGGLVSGYVDHTVAFVAPELAIKANDRMRILIDFVPKTRIEGQRVDSVFGVSLQFKTGGKR